MKLHFRNAALAMMLAQADRAWPNGTQPINGQAEGVEPGFWLVGDHGVYLMHNGIAAGERKAVAYADECDPTRLDFDAWWGNKNASFGADDGADFIEGKLLETAIRAGLDIVLDITPDGESFEVSVIEPGRVAA